MRAAWQRLRLAPDRVQGVVDTFLTLTSILVLAAFYLFSEATQAPGQLLPQVTGHLGLVTVVMGFGIGFMSLIERIGWSRILMCLVLILVGTIVMGQSAIKSSAYTQLAKQNVAVEEGDIWVRGPIGMTFDTVYLEAMEQTPQASRLRLSSRGGEMDSITRALTWPSSIYPRRAVVEDQCLSACAILWLSIPDRGCQPGAVVGFHRPSQTLATKPNVRSRTVIKWQSEWIALQGVERWFAEQATADAAMWYPSAGELTQAGVVPPGHQCNSPSSLADIARSKGSKSPGQ